MGVIISDDLRYEGGRLINDFFKRAKTDQYIKELKEMYKADKSKVLRIGDYIIKKTYRTLMTRGQKCCYIYCTDKALSKYFKDRVKQLKKDEIKEIVFKDLEKKNSSLLFQ